MEQKLEAIEGCNDTCCWSCCKYYAMELVRCPVCRATNANHNLTEAQQESLQA